jgi:hypoxanthine-DNA glycosylase
MPGAASLQAEQYYAHPRNAFWSIMGGLCGAGIHLPYAQRLQRLRHAGIALWDVLQQCQRDGSLDSSIRRHGMLVNDFATLLRECNQLRCICLNGGKAAALFHRQVAPQLQNDKTSGERWQQIKLLTMPSTSPAYAAMPAVRKHEVWQQLMRPFLHQPEGSVAESQHRVAD